MIAKITRGSDAAGLARYLHGPGRSNEHTYRRDGRTFSGGLVIGGTVPVVDDRDGSGWARVFKLAHKMRPRVQRNVWQCSLRADPSDRRLSDAQWCQVAEDLADRLGFAEHPYVVVRHADDHVHVAVSRVSDTGQVWKAAHDFRAVRPVMREAERRYGLRQVPDSQQAPTPKTGLTQGEERRARRTKTPPPRTQLAVLVRKSAAIAAGRGREAFEAELDRVGIRWRANVAGTGRMNGYSFAGHADAEGEPVWLAASKLDRNLSWSKLAPVLEVPAAGPAPKPTRVVGVKAQAETLREFWTTHPDDGPAPTVHLDPIVADRQTTQQQPDRPETDAERAARIARRGMSTQSPSVRPAPSTPPPRRTTPRAAPRRGFER
ncbi:relaxase/mobilization nuclease domain-containing protein [Gordonia sihwensis]|uniref:relaxase/mobilization nuclease domain-containing protein n=1 Tax=Gordonia sihwensis TaxID=173559 RepID=UPI000697754E|nr:relaxase/mobilization nuclease domain-containing protein [Gordonia sihwensis]